MLQFGHQFTIKATHGIPGKEARVAPPQVFVDGVQMTSEHLRAVVATLQQHQLEFLGEKINNSKISSKYKFNFLNQILSKSISFITLKQVLLTL